MSADRPPAGQAVLVEDITWDPTVVAAALKASAFIDRPVSHMSGRERPLPFKGHCLRGCHSNIMMVASSRSRLVSTSRIEWISLRRVSGANSPAAVARMT